MLEDEFYVDLKVTANPSRAFIRTCWGVSDALIDSLIEEGLTLRQIDNRLYAKAEAEAVFSRKRDG